MIAGRIEDRTTRHRLAGIDEVASAIACSNLRKDVTITMILLDPQQMQDGVEAMVGRLE